MTFNTLFSVSLSSSVAVTPDRKLSSLTTRVRLLCLFSSDLRLAMVDRAEPCDTKKESMQLFHSNKPKIHVNHDTRKTLPTAFPGPDGDETSATMMEWITSNSEAQSNPIHLVLELPQPLFLLLE
mmetsp:Transcript_32501/g.60036  ORF Transcript_32501/g.60036 Transcript_32501/m.60036 type:complete len:125 (+) Transcript_32501:2350-2724(+)